jgi:hypothetical protein
MARRLLITVRHPGPAELILSSLPALSAYAEILILATDSALRHLSDRAMPVLRQYVTRVVVPAKEGFLELDPRLASNLPSASGFSTELDPADVRGAEHLLAKVDALFVRDLPDFFLRTTPASKLGVDELVATALRRRGYPGRIHCVQDYYGVGIAMRQDEHPVARVGIDEIATVDAAAAEFASALTGLRAQVLGWVSFEQYLSGMTYGRAREKGRAALGLGPDRKLVLYAGICSGLVDNDVRDFEKSLQAVCELTSRKRAVSLAVRTHPRCSPEERQSYTELCERYASRVCFQSLDGLATIREIMAVPDVIISPASAFNLDALAYASTDPRPETCSVYSTGIYATRALHSLTGMSAPPTHKPRNGHFVASYEDMADVVAEALFSPDARSLAAARAAELYRPDGKSANRLARFLGLLPDGAPAVDDQGRSRHI